jgi:hypothetical protein
MTKDLTLNGDEVARHDAEGLVVDAHDVDDTQGGTMPPSVVAAQVTEDVHVGMAARGSLTRPPSPKQSRGGDDWLAQLARNSPTGSGLSPVGEPSKPFVRSGSSVDSDGLMGRPAEMQAVRPVPVQLVRPEAALVPHVRDVRNPAARETSPNSLGEAGAETWADKAHRSPLDGRYVCGPQVPGQPPDHDVSAQDLGDQAHAAAFTSSRRTTSPNAKPPRPKGLPAVLAVSADAIRRASS